MVLCVVRVKKCIGVLSRARGSAGTVPLIGCGGEKFMVKVTINGVGESIDADGDMPLLWALRDTLGLTGTKYGCGIGACGACTVHVDGQATRACVTPLSTVSNKSVTTIEGLGKERLHAVQQAWMDENVPQCGYCQAGQIMNAAALLARNAKPSDQDIDQAMAGNLCRCGTYLRIRQAVHRAVEIAGARPTQTARAGE
jgi:isoquinoline 1-oxidoreductase alpha subunit